MSTIGCSNNQNNSNSGAPVKRGPVDVVLISGQSNAVGCTQSIYLPDTMGVDKYNEYFDGYEDIQIAFDSWTKDWPNGYDKAATFYSQNASRKNDFVKVALGQKNGGYHRQTTLSAQVHLHRPICSSQLPTTASLKLVTDRKSVV